VHGRYLLGLYLSALVIAWSAAPRLAQSDRIPRARLLTAAAGSGCLVLHVYAMVFLLARYF
jgi:hypothetical protein